MTWILKPALTLGHQPLPLLGHHNPAYLWLNSIKIDVNLRVVFSLKTQFLMLSCSVDSQHSLLLLLRYVQLLETWLICSLSFNFFHTCFSLLWYFYKVQKLFFYFIFIYFSYFDFYIFLFFYFIWLCHNNNSRSIA